MNSCLTRIWSCLVSAVVPEADKVQIPADVSVDSRGVFNASEVVVDGSLTTNSIAMDNGIYVSSIDNLIVNGSMLVNSLLTVDQISGRENIRFSENGQIHIRKHFYTLDSLEAGLAEAAADPDTQHYRYYLNIVHNGPQSGAGTFVIDRDLTVPANASLNVYYMKAIISAGTHLTANGSVNVYQNGSLIVRGELENNSWLYASYEEGASLLIDEGGVYSGEGSIQLYAPAIETEEELAEVTGLDLSFFTNVQHN